MAPKERNQITPEAQRIAIAELPEIAITLTQGFEAIIDKEDWSLVAGRKWRVKRNGRTNYAISDS